MEERTITIVWRIACAVAAVYLAWNREWVAAGIFALAAK